MTAFGTGTKMAMVARPGELLIETTCWSCGTRLMKAVRRQRGPRHISWYCGRCEVSWSERI